MPCNYEILFEDETNFIIYKVKKHRSHHANGGHSISCERIAPEDLSKDTLMKLMQKGLAKLPQEVLP